MRRVVAHVATQQARVAAGWLAAAWAATAALALGAAFVAGDPAPDPLALAALALGPAIGVAAPLAIVAHVVRLHESGERLALAAGGVPGGAAVLGLALPWLPLVALLGVYAHATRPAALARAVDASVVRLARDPLALLPQLGVAIATVGDRRRVLVPYGDGVVGIELDSPPEVAGGRARLGPGRATVVGDDADRAARFASVALGLPVPVRPLGSRTEHELSTAFVERALGRWVRARTLSRQHDARATWAAELRRRDAVVPCALVALVACAATALAARPRVVLLWGAVAFPAIAIALLGPRLAGALA